jgi:hypothetical protein
MNKLSFVKLTASVTGILCSGQNESNSVSWVLPIVLCIVIRPHKLPITGHDFVVERLPRVCEALGSIPSIAGKKSFQLRNAYQGPEPALNTSTSHLRLTSTSHRQEGPIDTPISTEQKTEVK